MKNNIIRYKFIYLPILLLFFVEASAQKTTTNTTVTTDDDGTVTAVTTNNGTTIRINNPRYKFEKTKTVIKSYPLGNNELVNINNTYGRVMVNNWRRNEVKVIATVKSRAATEAEAQRNLDRVEIAASDGSTKNFSTRLDNRKGNNSYSLTIDYDVFIPENGNLNITNSFGNTTLPDRNGKTNISQSYGSVKAGQLPRIEKLNLSYGGIKALMLGNGKLNISYSDIKIDELVGDIIANIDYCGAELGIGEAFDNLKINSNYSDVKLKTTNKVNPKSISINTSYGDVKNKSSIKIIDQTVEKKYGPTFNRTYSGHNASGKASIIINSTFGDISIQ